MSSPETSAHHPAYFTPRSPTEVCQPGSQWQRDERGLGEAGGGGESRGRTGEETVAVLLVTFTERAKIRNRKRFANGCAESTHC